MSEFSHVDLPQRLAREQVESAFDFHGLIRTHIDEMVRKESEALRMLLAVAATDESKPGILIKSEFKGIEAEDTYVFEQTVEFDESVPRGEVQYAPMPTGWLDEL